MSYDYDALVSEITASRRLAKEAEAGLGDDADATTELELLDHLAGSVDKFEALSKNCPMTPLLWMQYALDTFELMKVIKKQENPLALEDHSSLLELLDTRVQLLELGLHEFPGSAILRLHHAELVMATGKLRKDNISDTKYQKLLDDAIEELGNGSHRNEAKLIVEFYKLRCDHAQDCGTDVADNLSKLFLQRASTPMNEGINAGLGEQYASYATKFTQASTLAEIEQRRRFEAKHYGFLVTYEDDIDVALETESGVSNANGIDKLVTASTSASENEKLDSIWKILQKWKDILDGDNGGCWMGLGGSQTANAFSQYATACYRYRFRNKDDDGMTQEEQKVLQTRIQSMAVSVFERGIAECPTVDTLWLSYLRRLNYLIEGANQSQEKMGLLTKASAVVDRAIRNCPYSTELVKGKLKIVLAMANAGMLVLDPEELLTNVIIKDTLENGFVQPVGESNSPFVAVELFQALLSVVRNRILFVLSEAAQTKVTTKNGKERVTSMLKCDDPESIQMVLNKTKPLLDGKTMGDEGLQELEDLCNDLREIYDEADSYLRKNHKKLYKSENNTVVTVEEGRVILTKERAVVESQLVYPLLHTINQGDENADQEGGRDRLTDVLQQHDRATKIWQPPHPGTYMDYIQAFVASSSIASSTISTPTDVLRNIRMVRFLYQRSLKSVGNPNKNPSEGSKSTLSPDELDYETSLRCLCRNYLLFEKHFGSDHSYSECQKAVQKKLAKAYALAANNSHPIAATAVANTIETNEEEVPMALDDENDNTTITQKRKRADETEGESKEDLLPPPVKRAKEEEAPEEPAKKKPTNFQELEELKGRKIYPKHKIKVGKLEYPAHPFTIKVSFLSPETQDMDLVDSLRPKCGPIVHAKIMRDKHSHKSKGWACVQFEERESVETALGLSDVLGIKGKSVIIERSHLPAIGLVPSGLHRVNPKGEGKSTKRNQRNKKCESKGAKPASKPESESKPAASTASIFAFRPRGVGAQQQRKAKISISSLEAKKGAAKDGA